jgi:hypothetical protein
MNKDVARVAKLIALSASSSIEEARTAAYQACKIIREKKLQIRDSSDVSGFVDMRFTVEEASDDFFDCVIDCMREAAREANADRVYRSAYEDHFQDDRQRAWEREQLRKQSEELERRRAQARKRTEEWEEERRKREARVASPPYPKGTRFP